jgi:hypothetical protein
MWCTVAPLWGHVDEVKEKRKERERKNGREKKKKRRKIETINYLFFRNYYNLY